MMDDAIRRIQAGGTGFLQQELQQLQQLQVQERLALTGESLDKTTSFSRDPGAALGTLQKLRGDIEEDYRGALQSEKASAAEFRDLEVSKLKERRCFGVFRHVSVQSCRCFSFMLIEPRAQWKSRTAEAEVFTAANAAQRKPP